MEDLKEAEAYTEEEIDEKYLSDCDEDEAEAEEEQD